MEGLLTTNINILSSTAPVVSPQFKIRGCATDYLGNVNGKFFMGVTFLW